MIGDPDPALTVRIRLWIRGSEICICQKNM